MSSVSIVITCHGKARELPGLLSCIENQHNYVDGKHSRTGSRVPFAKTQGPSDISREIIICSDGPYEGSPLIFENLIECEKQGGVGHHTRGPGIQAATKDWVVCTNQDNVFFLGWLSAISEFLKNPKVGMITWNVINNLWAWQAAPNGITLTRGNIDLSCAAVRRSVAQEVGFPFHEYDGDFDYLDACFQVARRTTKIPVVHTPYILGVHN